MYTMDIQPFGREDGGSRRSIGMSRLWEIRQQYPPTSSHDKHPSAMLRAAKAMRIMDCYSTLVATQSAATCDFHLDVPNMKQSFDQELDHVL
jgi:hypothetical protein